MDVLFTAHIVYDKPTYQEIYRVACFRRPSRYLLFALLALSLLLQVLLALYSHTYTTLLVYALLVLIFVGLVVFQYTNAVRLSLRRNREQSGSEILRIDYTMTETTLSMLPSQGAKSSLLYSDIRFVLLTKRLLLLITRSHGLYAIQKDTFSCGRYSDFLAFLQKKGCKIKRKTKKS